MYRPAAGRGETIKQVNLRLDGSAAARRAGAEFVRRSTRFQHPARVSEVGLYLADEMTPIWQSTETELGRTGIDPPFWAFAWAGGQAVARHLLDVPSEVAGARVLDLASGSGLVAICALLAGAASAVSLDLDPLAGIAAGVNAAANGVAGRFSVVTADVLEGIDQFLDRPSGGAEVAGVEVGGVDLVVAGDVCYDRDMTPRVLEALARAAANGVRVLLGDPGRTYLPGQGLELVATYDVPTTADLEGREICPSSVYLMG